MGTEALPGRDSGDSKFRKMLRASAVVVLFRL
jgi:hypothetical protein